jgi:transcriptional antiterminator NusG
VGAYGSNKPKPLSKNEINALFDQMGEQKVKEKVSVVLDFDVGEHVKVIDGPFNNFSGVIEEVYPEKGRLRVKVEIFGRGTPVELDFLQVGKI